MIKAWLYEPKVGIEEKPFVTLVRVKMTGLFHSNFWKETPLYEDSWLPIELATREYGVWIIGCREGQFDSVEPVTWREGAWHMVNGEQWKHEWLTHFKFMPKFKEAK